MLPLLTIPIGALEVRGGEVTSVEIESVAVGAADFGQAVHISG
jgi:hypothetical protein